MALARRLMASFACAVLRGLELLLALYVVGVSGYHLRKITSSSASPSAELYAIIVISAAAALYTLVTSATAWLLPGVFHLIHAVLDLLFCGGFIALAVLLRNAGKASCNLKALTTSSANAVGLWVSDDNTVDNAYRDTPIKTCDIDKAAFAVSIAAAVLFALSALCSYWAFRQYRRNRAFGPGPSNGYSFGRRNRRAPKKNGGAAVESDENDLHPESSTAPVVANAGQEAYGYGDAQNLGTFTRQPAYARNTPGPLELNSGGGMSERGMSERGGGGLSDSSGYASVGSAGGFNPKLKEGGYSTNY